MEHKKDRGDENITKPEGVENTYVRGFLELQNIIVASPHEGEHTRDIFEKLFESLPRAVRNEIEQQCEGDKRDITDGHTLRIRRIQYIRSSCEIYGNKRFGEDFLSLEGSKKIIQDEIRGAFHETDAARGVERLSRMARVSIDANGLKAVNDLAGHEAGNIFLDRFAQKCQDIRKELIRAYPFLTEVSVSVEGGDEFGITLLAEFPLIPRLTEDIRLFIQKALVFDCSDLLSKEFISKEGIAVDERYAFHSSAGVGITTLDEALLSTENVSALLKDFKSRGPHRPELELMSTRALRSVFDSADRNMQFHKKEMKGGLDPTTKEVLARSNEVRELLHERKRLQEDLANCLEARDSLF